MIVRVHRPTHILADEGLHEVSASEAARLFAIGAAEAYIEPTPDPEPTPVPEKPAKKKTPAKKKSTTKK